MLEKQASRVAAGEDPIGFGHPAKHAAVLELPNLG
jgi:hypothetical protein